jgi:hypothetical protein
MGMTDVGGRCRPRVRQNAAISAQFQLVFGKITAADHSLGNIHPERTGFTDDLKMIDLVEGTIKFLSASPALAVAADFFLLVIGLWIVWALFVRH